MQLPDFLTADDGGFIHPKGHRVGLHHVIRAYREGASVEAIVTEYPTLPRALVHKMVAFYLENRPDMDAYIADHDRAMERLMAQPRQGPTLEELRERLAARQRAVV